MELCCIALYFIYIGDVTYNGVIIRDRTRNREKTLLLAGPFTRVGVASIIVPLISAHLLLGAWLLTVLSHSRMRFNNQSLRLSTKGAL